jgi:hypothetical protein
MECSKMKDVCRIAHSIGERFWDIHTFANGKYMLLQIEHKTYPQKLLYES